MNHIHNKLFNPLKRIDRIRQKILPMERIDIDGLKIDLNINEKTLRRLLMTLVKEGEIQPICTTNQPEKIFESIVKNKNKEAVEAFQKQGYGFFRKNISQHPILKELADKYFQRAYFYVLYFALSHKVEIEDKVHKCIEIYRKSFDIPIKERDGLIRGRAYEVESVLKTLRKKHIEDSNGIKRKNTYPYILLIEILYYMNTTEMTVEDWECIQELAYVFKIPRKRYMKLLDFSQLLLKQQVEEVRKLSQGLQSELKCDLSYFIEQAEQAYVQQEKEEIHAMIVATMSAGKSTFINALLGQDMFPAKNQACTAKMTQLKDNDYLEHFIGCAARKDGSFIWEADVSEKTLDAWNQDESIHSISVEGDLARISHTEKNVVLIDTPGPNNSRDEMHQKTTTSLLDQHKYDLVLYVLNATQLGTEDDQVLLDYVLKKIKSNNQREIELIFVLNKIDAFDIDAGESIEQAVASTVEYLKKLGISEPKLVAVSAYAAKVFKKALANQELSRKERNDFSLFFEIFSDSRYNLNQYSTLLLDRDIDFSMSVEGGGLTHIGEKQYEKKAVLQALHHTGILKIETIINNYLENK